MWLILSFISAGLSAAAAVSQKKVLFREGALEFSYKLSFFNLIFSLPFFLLVNPNDISLTSILILYIKTIIGTLAFLNVMLTLKNLDISGALPMMVLTPGLVAVFAFLFVGDKLSSFEISGMLLLVVGTYLLEMNGSKSIFEPFTIFYKSKKHHYIVFALLLFTITAILDRLLLVKYKMPPTSLMAFQHLFFFINFALIIIIKKKNLIPEIKNTPVTTLKYIAIISIITIGYRWTNIEAIKLAPVALVLSIKRTSTFFASLIGGKLFNEPNLARRVIAAAIMSAGAIIIINY